MLQNLSSVSGYSDLVKLSCLRLTSAPWYHDTVISPQNPILLIQALVLTGLW